MKVALDECVPVQVRSALPNHDVATTPKMGWKSLSNGDLLVAAESAGFNLLIIADRNLSYQQNLAKRKIAILELWTNHRPTLEKHFSRIHEAVEKILPGDYVVLDNS
ncbi:MAG: hypothetical protein ABI042_00685 [Verrucomicrobiota bacterium]